MQTHLRARHRSRALVFSAPSKVSAPANSTFHSRECVEGVESIFFGAGLWERSGGEAGVYQVELKP